MRPNLSTGLLTPSLHRGGASKPAKLLSPLDPLSRSAVMSVQPLLTPLHMGDLDLPNRIVMAPLTRMRAGSIDHVPTALQAEYYAQRGSAGLIVAEATAISADGFGYADTPGLWTADQLRGWRLVTDAVHAAGGRIIAQVWHTGAIAHPDMRGGSQAINKPIIRESLRIFVAWPARRLKPGPRAPAQTSCRSNRPRAGQSVAGSIPPANPGTLFTDGSGCT